MKKHKTEIAALCLLLGTLCYAFYDCNIKDNEQNFTLSNELLSMRKISSKEEITMDMLSIPTEDLLREQGLQKKEQEVKEETKEEVVEENNEPTEEVIIDEPVEVYEEVYVPPYNESISSQIVNYALQFVGNPYVYGGNSLTDGTDCSGFTSLIYATFGIYLPRSAPTQSYSGYSIGLDNIMPGDLVFSGYNGQICHVAIYIGNGQLVHALNENVGIVVTSLYIMPILDVRRVI